MSSPAEDFGVVRVDRGEVEVLVQAERERGAVILSLTTGAGADKAAFFDAACAALPLDPPLTS
jgi:hypothetical protein